MVTDCPPVALLALIELLNHVLTHHHTEKITESSPGRNEPDRRHNETDALPATRRSAASSDPRTTPEPTAEQKMWAYYVTERSKCYTPTGAELDRVFSTNNYGRSVLRKGREKGRTLPAPDPSRRDGHRGHGHEGHRCLTGRARTFCPRSRFMTTPAGS